MRRRPSRWVAGLALGLLLAPGIAAPGERALLLGEFLDRHWKTLPLAPQGAAPEEWSPAERSLDPEHCGSCHPQQLAQWRDSLHARAYSPGFSGQLVEGTLAAPDQVRACQGCHAPLGEQQAWNASLAPEPDFDPSLRDRGLVCAGCHVRAHRRFGPPRRPGMAEPGDDAPHAGFTQRTEFQQSRFCAPCHQFFDDPGPNGKPAENTFREWQASPFATAGRQCQSCHMPDRAHSWRGIHDPDFVRAAVDVELIGSSVEGERIGAGLTLRSRDVGHFFPTYVTPRVILALWQQDGQGRELDDTREELTIGRRIDFGSQPPSEVFDTRVPPRGTARLNYARPRHAQAAELVGRVTVDPDFHYRGVFETLLETLTDPGARARISEALRRTSESIFVLSEVRQPLSGPGTPPK
jgi:hypothetical protein